MHFKDNLCAKYLTTAALMMQTIVELVPHFFLHSCDRYTTAAKTELIVSCSDGVCVNLNILLHWLQQRNVIIKVSPDFVNSCNVFWVIHLQHCCPVCKFVHGSICIFVSIIRLQNFVSCPHKHLLLVLHRLTKLIKLHSAVVLCYMKKDVIDLVA